MKTSTRAKTRVQQESVFSAVTSLTGGLAPCTNHLRSPKHPNTPPNMHNTLTPPSVWPKQFPGSFQLILYCFHLLFGFPFFRDICGLSGQMDHLLICFFLFDLMYFSWFFVPFFSCGICLLLVKFDSQDLWVCWLDGPFSFPVFFLFVLMNFQCVFSSL